MIDARKFVIAEYQAAVRESTCSPILKQALRTSDRVPVFISRMADEISKAEFAVFKRKGKVPKIETLRWAVREMTHVFLNNMDQAAIAQIRSALEAERLALQAAQVQEPEKHIKEMGVLDAPDRTEVTEI